MGRFIDLTGQKFGRLTAIERIESYKQRSRWLCLCECGNTNTVLASHLRSGAVRSCGCLSKDVAADRGIKSKIGERTRKHGDFGTRLYGIWAAMKRRCYNSHTRYFADYGGRGIAVCEEWHDYINFKQWALSTGYTEG
ncbi:MAG: hypothetical protein IKT32_03965, partial [Clostridia bacterium]|nr:hypothetical protein [Clostridia bacterium]